MNTSCKTGTMLVLAGVLAGCQAALPRAGDSSPAWPGSLPTATVFTPPPLYTEREQAVLDRLEQIIHLDLPPQPMGVWVDVLREEFRLPIHVDWQVMEIDHQLPLALTLHNTTASAALDMLVSGLASEAGQLLAWDVQDQTIVITTQQHLYQAKQTRIYPVRDLLMPQWSRVWLLYQHDEQSIRQWRAWEYVTSQRRGLVFYLEPPQPGSAEYARMQRDAKIMEAFGEIFDRVDESMFVMTTGELVELIYDTVGDDPLMWSSRGGDLGSITELQGNLIVRAHRHIHLQIAELFDLMRADREQLDYRTLQDIEVMQLLRQAERYRLEQDYPRALALVHRAGHVDPEHRLVRAMKRLLDDILDRYSMDDK